MYVIDFHCHVYPEAVAQKAADNIRDFYNLGNKTMDGRVQTLLERGTAAGVEKFVLQPVALRPTNTRHINDFILGELAKEPRFYGYGTIHAGMQNLCGEVEYIMQKGLRGIKMHPDYQIFAIDDPRLFPVYDMIGDRLPILFHVGDPRYDYSHPARLRKVLGLFPKLRVIASHFGGYSMYDTAVEQLSDKDCYFDISSSLMLMEAGAAEKYINHYGAERFVYGSDFPMWDPVVELERFMQLKLTDAQKEQIAHITAEELLKV